MFLSTILVKENIRKNKCLSSIAHQGHVNALVIHSMNDGSRGFANLLMLQFRICQLQ